MALEAEMFKIIFEAQWQEILGEKFIDPMENMIKNIYTV